LKLAYRTLGELTVGFTHSFAVILCGFVFMGGSFTNTIPWALGLPLFLSILPSITLSGIPDYEADKHVGKKTIAVKFGRKNAALAAVTFAWLAVLAVALLQNRFFDGLLYGAVPHAVLLSRLVYRYINQAQAPKRIDWILVCALIFLMWFVIVPLWHAS
jgi:4-hydroxybenzoate polyprenyltransferase